MAPVPCLGRRCGTVFRTPLLHRGFCVAPIGQL